ncbi:bolA-like protein 1 [Colius striatus]|uniref:bolA-like protein 1 n=1 Tax=Colius striatus TaxID=57412 RepID=UPI002B1D646D|nr:bolA-like protein 1 [Colius striatus]
MRGPLLAAASRGLLAMGDSAPLARTIRSKLTQALEPTHLQVLDESSRHGVPPGTESHFSVVVVSGRFVGLSPLQRHRLVHDALGAELAGPLHALAIVARTPEQWQRDPHVPPRPPCLGGSKREQREEGGVDPETAPPAGLDGGRG